MSWVGHNADRIVVIYSPADLFGGPVVLTRRSPYRDVWTEPEHRDVAVIRREPCMYVVVWSDGSPVDPGSPDLREEPTPGDIRELLRDRGVSLVSPTRVETAPVRRAAESAAVLHAAMRRTTTAADLLAAPYTRRLCREAALTDRAYSADLLEYAPKSAVVEAVASLRVEIMAERRREEAERRRREAEQRRIDSDPHRCRIPDYGATVSTLLRQLVLSPGDETLAAALTDAYIDAGAPPEAAGIYVSRIIRYGRAKAALTATTARGGALRAMVRRAAGCGGANRVPITIVTGVRADEPPRMTGEPPSHSFRGGGICRYPGAALRQGYRVEYTADSRSVTVGVAWLARLIDGERA